LTKPIIVIGGGGHAKVLLEILRKQGANILAVIAPEPIGESAVLAGLKQYFSDEDVFTFNPADILLVNGIGSLPNNTLRHTIYEKYTAAGYSFASVVSNNSTVSEYCSLSQGVQIMPGAIVNVDVVIGENTIINSGAIIEHDCDIGRHNHVAPGAALSGSVKTGDYVHIGTGARVIQSLNIGSNCLIAAGATLTKNIATGNKLYSAKPYLQEGSVK
jgi:sugar O-acyltransferase (sialic acid O-acetyltransferase NeuD family)